MNYLVPDYVLEGLADTIRAITNYSDYLEPEDFATVLADNFTLDTATNFACFNRVYGKKIVTGPFSVMYTNVKGEIIKEEDLTNGEFYFQAGSAFNIKNFTRLVIRSSSGYQEVTPAEGYDFAFKGNVTGDLNQ